MLAVEQAKVEAFVNDFRGRVVFPNDSDYDEVRAVWNGMIDKRPAMIAQCMGTADVISSVNFAQEHGLPVSARGGGHNVAGNALCDDGIVIDFSKMKLVRVDPTAKRAYVSAGATLADLDHETQAFGLAAVGGVDSRTGVAGLTLGGGTGYLSRAYGISADNLMSADVVTAGGNLVHASEEENPDLLWALRGGGGNFGVLTSFEFKLHEVGPEVMTAQIFHPIEKGKEVLQFHRDFLKNAPDKLSVYALVVHVPPVAPFPEEFHGKSAIALVACYAGDMTEGKKLLEPLENFGDPILKAVMPMPYKVLQQSFDAGTPDGQRYYYKSQYLTELSDSAIDTILNYTKDLPGPFTIIGVEPMGGAINQVDKSATAFPHRNAAFNLGIWSGWSDSVEDTEMINWSREFHTAMEPFSTGGVYSNYMSDDEESRVKEAYGGNFDRLTKVKTKYDPDNFFRRNQNIKP